MVAADSFERPGPGRKNEVMVWYYIPYHAPLQVARRAVRSEGPLKVPTGLVGGILPIEALAIPRAEKKLQARIRAMKSRRTVSLLGTESATVHILSSMQFIYLSEHTELPDCSLKWGRRHVTVSRALTNVWIFIRRNCPTIVCPSASKRLRGGPVLGDDMSRCYFRWSAVPLSALADESFQS